MQIQVYISFNHRTEKVDYLKWDSPDVFMGSRNGRLAKREDIRMHPLKKLYLIHSSGWENELVHWTHPGLGGEGRGKPQSKMGGKSKLKSYQSHQLLAFLKSGSLSWWEKEVIFLVPAPPPKGIHWLAVFFSLTYVELVKNALRKH